MEQPPGERGAPGRPPTMEDVAVRAGVSRALVSIVVRDLPGASPANRERVRRAAAELGYRPDRRASLLGRKRTNLLGVTFAVGHGFHADLVAALYAAAAAQGLELALSGVTPQRREQQAVTELLSLRCDAVVLVAPTQPVADLARLAAATPLVVLARSVSAPEVEVVRTDDELGARLATEHLLGLGHRRIVHLDGGRAPGAVERRRGVLRALAAAGVPPEGVLHPGGLTEGDGERAAETLLAGRSGADGSGPTAVLAFNDRCAVGFLATVRAAGVGVPEDLSLVGYDDIPLASASWIRLTTVAQDTATLADRAVARARERIADPAGPPRPATLVPPALVIRATTGAPPPGRLWRPSVPPNRLRP